MLGDLRSELKVPRSSPTGSFVQYVSVKQVELVERSQGDSLPLLLLFCESECSWKKIQIEEKIILLEVKSNKILVNVNLVLPLFIRRDLGTSPSVCQNKKI